jgi:non-heme Fe2+,alpha-ketoglutarate-dependent halogenase
VSGDRTKLFREVAGRMAKVLTKSQIKRYETYGFLGPISLLTEQEALDIRQKIECVEAELGEQIQSRCKIKAHLPFKFLFDLISHPRLLDAVEDIIGPDILCWGSSFFQKEANDPGYVSWHQDSTYYGLEPCETLTAWIAISEASLESGCMRFLPGSHNQGLYSHTETMAADNILSRGQTVAGVDESLAVPVPLEAGQFSFHKEDVLHASHPNTTNDRRIGLSIHYIRPEVRETGFPGASALLLRGQDKFGHWLEDIRPETDFDRLAMKEVDRVWEMYQLRPEERAMGA